VLNVYALEQEITALMDETQVPGLALAVIAELTVLYAAGFGVTSREDGGVMTSRRVRACRVAVPRMSSRRTVPWSHPIWNEWPRASSIR
jgi:hypothetical protein